MSDKDNYFLLVRLSRGVYNKGGSFVSEVKITPLKSKSTASPSDYFDSSAEYLYKDLINLDESPDGVYKIVPCNESYDYESGVIDYWELKLEPYDNSQAVDDNQ